ncbi:hypothetical protein SHIRM173S_05220 [Streptomyces hirsutus]
MQVPGGRSSLVVLVRTADDTPAVLKLAPARARPESERAALAHWNGLGTVRLLEPSSPDGALLLERLHPDVSVRSLPEAKALLEAAATLRRLWVEPPAGDTAHTFETVAERTGRQAEAMRAGAAGFPEVAPLVSAALEAREELLAAPPEHQAAARHVPAKQGALRRADAVAGGGPGPGGGRARLRPGPAGPRPRGGPHRPALRRDDDPPPGEAPGRVPGDRPGTSARLDAVPRGGVRRARPSASAATGTRSFSWSSPAGSDTAWCRREPARGTTPRGLPASSW